MGGREKDFFFKIEFIYLFLERGEGRKRRRETLMWGKNMDWLLLVRAPTGDWAHKPGLRSGSDHKLNQWPFTLRDYVQTTWATSVRAATEISNKR